MIYTLYLWTVVAMAGDRFYQAKAMDWRPAGEFSTKELCEDTSRQLGVRAETARCVRSK